MKNNYLKKNEIYQVQEIENMGLWHFKSLSFYEIFKDNSRAYWFEKKNTKLILRMVSQPALSLTDN